MKEKKEIRFEVRLTAAEKEQLKDYAARHSVSMSEAVRMICF